MTRALSKWLVLAAGAYFVLTGIYAIVHVMLAARGIPSNYPGRSLDIIRAVVFGVFLVAVGVVGTIGIFRGERIQAGRAEAFDRAASAGDLLAREQPVPVEQFTAFPIVLEVRTNWARYFAYLAIWTCAWTAILAIVFYLNGSKMLGIGDFITRYYVGIALGPIPYALMYFATRQQVEMTPVGVLLRAGRTTQFVAFESAQLFAIAKGHRRKWPPIEYELTNASYSVRWARMRRHMPFDLFRPITAMKPTMPIEEYNRQMETILGVIAARTGLPLYDLR